MIQLTEKAVVKIKEFAEAEGLTLSVRLKVSGGGCSGFVNDMEFDHNVGELDEVIEQGEIKLLIDPLSFQYLEGSTIDFVDSPFGSGFKFLNPNVKHTCGCGSSVSY